MSAKKILLFLVATVTAFTVSAVVDARTWTDRSGQFQIEAEMIGYQRGKVRLRTKDGSVRAVQIDDLSVADQRFVQRFLKRQRNRSPDQNDKQLVALDQPGGSTGWSQWRGPQRDGHSTETGLLDRWPQDGPPLSWQAANLGRGYSSVAVAGGRVFTMGTRDGQEQLIALDEKTGQELWAVQVGDGDHSNCTPTVAGQFVFALGLNGDLVCAEADTGNQVWRLNYARDFGGQMMSGWGYSESPLVDGDLLVCTPGAGGAIMAALDLRTGRKIWQTPRPDNLGERGTNGAGYSSIVVSEAAGVRQYVQLIGKGVVGVSSKDGELLWSYNRIANGTANIPTPIVNGDYVFCSTGYQTGAALLKVHRNGQGFVAQEIYFLDHKQLQNHHGGMIRMGDYVYCGHGHNRGFPICVQISTGDTVWGPGRGPGSGSAAVAFADSHLYFRYENGIMALIEATPREYRLKGQFRIASHHDKSWPHPVISGGKLFLRDQHELHCYDIAKQ